MNNGDGVTAKMRPIDLDEDACIVFWEMTRSCGLKCVHCRAEAIDRRDPAELTTEEAFGLLDELGSFAKPIVVLTGGDPLMRPDVFDIVGYGTKKGLRMALTPSATPTTTEASILALKRQGLSRLAVSLDGSRALIHDGFRQVAGSYSITLEIIRWANEAGLPIQINTTVTRRNLNDIDAIADLLSLWRVALWSVFFLVPVGRGSMGDEPRATEYEQVFRKLADFSRRYPFDIKTTEAPHYRRILIELRKAGELGGKGNAGSSRPSADAIGRFPFTNDGKGIVFVSHTGEIYPSGFLPIACGNVKTDSIADVYRRSPVFKSLRDADQLKGKCGACEYRRVCGGSRARAWAVTGDYLGSEPFCVHMPRGYAISTEETRYW